MLPRSAFSSFVIVNNAIPHLYPEAKWREISRDIVHWLSSRMQVKENILSLSLCLSLSLLCFYEAALCCWTGGTAPQRDMMD